MARVFIDSPLSPLLMLATLVIGVLALIFTPRQEDPQISVPMVDIFVDGVSDVYDGPFTVGVDGTLVEMNAGSDAIEVRELL